jgi:phospholipid/cholesterol/gamma-HCH transport system substrate-binding protein
LARPRSQLWNRIAGVAAILAFLGFAYAAVTSGSKAVRGEKDVTLYVSDALGLVENSAVMVAGVQVGRVKGLSVAHDKAKIVIALDPTERIPRRVRGIVRARSLLGEKFLELIPKEAKPSGPYLASGDVIGEGDTEKTLELDQFATDFDPLITRIERFLDAVNPPDPQKPNLIDSLADATGSLAEGLHGKEAVIGDLVDNLNDAVSRADGIIARNSERGGRVFDNLDAVLIDGKRTQIVPRLSEAATSMTTVAKEVEKDRTVAKLDTVLVRLDPILARAEKIDEMALRKFFQVEGIKGHVRAW